MGNELSLVPASNKIGQHHNLLLKNPFARAPALLHRAGVTRAVTPAAGSLPPPPSLLCLTAA